MSYGRSMSSWESREDAHQEKLWADQLKQAISACNNARIIELMKSGLINSYDFPDFPKGSWLETTFESLKREY